MTRFATIPLALGLIVLGVGRTDAQDRPAATAKTTKVVPGVPAPVLQDTEAKPTASEQPSIDLASDETDPDRLPKLGEEAPTAFHLAFLGRWVLESGKIGGKTSETAHKPKALGATSEYAVAVFDYDRVFFGEDSDRPASGWSYDL